MQPARGYYLGKEIKKDSGVVTSSNKADEQKYQITAVGGTAFTESGYEIDPECKVGDVVYVVLHSTADTPQELKDKGMALFQFTRVLGKVTKEERMTS